MTVTAPSTPPMPSVDNDALLDALNVFREAGKAYDRGEKIEDWVNKDADLALTIGKTLKDTLKILMGRQVDTLFSWTIRPNHTLPDGVRLDEGFDLLRNVMIGQVLCVQFGQDGDRVGSVIDALVADIDPAEAYAQLFEILICDNLDEALCVLWNEVYERLYAR